MNLRRSQGDGRAVSTALRLPFALGLGLALTLMSATAESSEGEVGAKQAAAPKAAAAATKKEAEKSKDGEPSAADLAAGLVVQRDGEAAWHVNANITNLVGQGVFASGAGRNPTVITQLSAVPSVSVGPWLFFLSQAAQLEYTDPNNATGRRIALFDTSLGVQRALRSESLPLRLVLSGGVRLPVSWQSRAQGSIGGLFVGGTGIWATPLKGLQVALGVRGQLNSSIESLRATGETDGPSFEQEAANCLLRGGEGASDACGPIPNIANLSGSLQVAYTYERLTFALRYGVLSFVRAYSSPDDEFTADAARPGAAADTFSSGSLTATYMVSSHWLVSAGLSSFQPLQNLQGGVRFPFWNFDGVANGFSSVTVGATLVY